MFACEEIMSDWFCLHFTSAQEQQQMQCSELLGTSGILFGFAQLLQILQQLFPCFS